MVDADAATEIQDLDRLLIRMRDVETTEVEEGVRGAAVGGGGGGGSGKKHGLVVGSRAHMEGEAVAKVRFSFFFERTKFKNEGNFPEEKTYFGISNI